MRCLETLFCSPEFVRLRERREKNSARSRECVPWWIAKGARLTGKTYRAQLLRAAKCLMIDELSILTTSEFISVELGIGRN